MSERFAEPGATAPRFHVLQLRGLVLWVHLGCSSQEREKSQEVRVDVDLRFREMPRGARSDDLGDTLCYAELSLAIQDHCESREFNLIEKMGLEIYEICRAVSSTRAEVRVGVHKVRPPVDRLRGGSFYQCGDFI